MYLISQIFFLQQPCRPKTHQNITLYKVNASVSGEVINEGQELIESRERSRRKRTTQINMNKLQGGQGMQRGMFVKTTSMIILENMPRGKSTYVRNEKKANHHFLITY